MNIYEVLRSENSRVEVGDRWLVVEDDGEFTVYQHKMYSRATRVLYQGNDESEACHVLVSD